MPNGRPACDETRPEYMALNALAVITKDERILEFLQKKDPKALEQARDAYGALKQKLNAE